MSGRRRRKNKYLEDVFLSIAHDPLLRMTKDRIFFFVVGPDPALSTLLSRVMEVNELISQVRFPIPILKNSLKEK